MKYEKDLQFCGVRKAAPTQDVKSVYIFASYSHLYRFNGVWVNMFFKLLWEANQPLILLLKRSGLTSSQAAKLHSKKIKNTFHNCCHKVCVYERLQGQREKHNIEKVTKERKVVRKEKNLLTAYSNQLISCPRTVQPCTNTKASVLTSLPQCLTTTTTTTFVVFYRNWTQKRRFRVNFINATASF